MGKVECTEVGLLCILSFNVATREGGPTREVRSISPSLCFCGLVSSMDERESSSQKKKQKQKRNIDKKANRPTNSNCPLLRVGPLLGKLSRRRNATLPPICQFVLLKKCISTFLKRESSRLWAFANIYLVQTQSIRCTQESLAPSVFAKS